MTSPAFNSAQSDHLFDPIQTNRLIIRPFDRDDRQSFFAYKIMPEAVRFQSWRPQTLAEVDNFIREVQAVVPDTPGTWLQVAICLKENGELIGDIGMHFLEDGRQMEIGYTLSPVHWGKGYAAEAVTAMINYLFRGLKKHRITASVDPRNARSIALLERLGMRREAYFVKSYPEGDTWLDDVVYAILEEEWFQNNPMEN